MFYVNNRWLGGMLTNFRTIRTRVDRLNQIDTHGAAAASSTCCPRRKSSSLQHEREKLEANLGGIREMKKLPGALFVVDPRKEHIAVTEARMRWASRSWPSWTPTAIPTRSTTSSPATTTPSAP